MERAWDAGIFAVVAAGNRGADQSHLDSPSISPYVLAVGAVDSTTESNSKYQHPTAWSAVGDGTRNPLAARLLKEHPELLKDTLRDV